MSSFIERNPDDIAPSYYFFSGSAPVLLVSDHAGNETEDEWDTLGLSAEQWRAHIGHDVGIKEVGRLLAAAFDATLIEQRYSRLLLDCNRKPERADRIPHESDGITVPGNQNLASRRIRERVQSVFEPYHAKIAQTLDVLEKRFDDLLFVSLHSFTPRLMSENKARPWEIGFLYDHDPETAEQARNALAAQAPGLTIGMNEPYRLTPDKEYSTPVHAGRRGLRALEVEIRQDLISDEAGCALWAKRLEGVFSNLADPKGANV